MSKALTIVARIKAKAGRENQLAAALARIVGPTQTEAGCLQYDLHRDLEDTGNFLIFENWGTRDQWLAHMEAPHLLAFQTTVDDLVEVFELYQMEKTD